MTNPVYNVKKIMISYKKINCKDGRIILGHKNAVEIIERNIIFNKRNSSHYM